MKKILIIMLLLIIGSSSKATTNSPTFHKLDATNGLSYSAVRDIKQDMNGLLWIATLKGLNCYNGHNIKHYFSSEYGFQSDRIEAIEPVGKNMLIGSNNGLSLYLKELDIFKQIDYMGDSVGMVHDITTSNNGSIYITTNSGIYIYKDNELFHVSDTKALKITCDFNENIWALCSNHIEVISSSMATIDIINTAEFHDDSSKIEFTSIYTDSRGVIWVGTAQSGVFYLTNHLNSPEKIQINGKSNLSQLTYVRCFETAENGDIWIGTENGLFIYDIRKFHIEHYTKGANALSGNAIYAISMSHEGVMCVGSFFGGIDFVDTNSHLSYITADAHNNTIKGGAVSAILEDCNNNLWICSEDMGVSVLDTKSDKYTYYNTSTNPPTSGDNMHAIAEDHMGNIWVGHFMNGLNMINPKTGEITKFTTDRYGVDIEKSIYSLHFINKDSLLIGSNNGLSVLNISDRRIHTSYIEGLDNIRIDKIMRDSTQLWFCTHYNGIFHVDIESKKMINYSKENESAFKSNNIYCGFTDINGDFWFAGDNSGLIHYNSSDGVFSLYDNNKELLSQSIYSIEEDKSKNLWLSTNNGLLMFNTNDKKFIHFEVDKSLISNQFNYNSSLKDSNGVIYFGSINGLCYFHPDMMNLNEPNSEPSIYISDLSISGHQIHPTDPSNTLATTINNTNEIIVSHRDNTIELDFLAVSMVKTGKSMFYIKYKMDGIDNSWHERDNSPISVTYANMRSGKYTFDISLYNEFGVEIDSRRILIIIKVHPLLRWYMLLIYAILICLLIIYTINISNDSIKARLEATYEHLEKQNIIEINKQKLNFFTHISHEFRTPISILSTIFNENNQDQQHNLISQQDITIAINNTRKLRFLINQLMDFREIENEHGNITLSTSDIIKFLRNSFNLFTPVAKLKSINYLFDTNIESYTMQFDDDKIEKIINNLLSISFKNCYIADGSIIFNVTIDEPNKLLILRINNNKYYLNNEEQKLILASYYNASNTKGVINTDLSMSIVCGLVSRLNGDIDVQSDADCGTSFIVSLPLEYSIEQNNNNKDLNKHPSNSVEEYIYDIMFEEKSDSIAHLETTDNIQPDKHTILIVEDNASMNQLLYNKLNKYFKVITTYNGEEAMRELSNANVDLILSDITMPKLNGYELCNFVKSNKKYAHLHVILMTAHGSEETKLKSLKCGADSYMEKPLILEELIIRINNMLGVRKNIYEHYQSVLQFKFSSNVNNQEHQFIEKLSSFVVQNISDQTLNVEMLANYANMSKTLLYNKLKSAVNLSAMEFINSIRMNIAKEKIITTDLSIAEIAWQTGFNTPSYFSRAFKRHFGTAPNELRSKS